MGPLKENPAGYDEFYALWAFLSHSSGDDEDGDDDNEDEDDEDGLGRQLSTTPLPPLYTVHTTK